MEEHKKMKLYHNMDNPMKHLKKVSSNVIQKIQEFKSNSSICDTNSFRNKKTQCRTESNLHEQEETKSRHYTSIRSGR